MKKTVLYNEVVLLGKLKKKNKLFGTKIGAKKFLGVSNSNISAFDSSHKYIYIFIYMYMYVYKQIHVIPPSPFKNINGTILYTLFFIIHFSTYIAY